MHLSKLSSASAETLLTFEICIIHYVETVLSFATYITDYRMVETPLTLLTTQKHYSPLKIELHSLSLREKTLFIQNKDLKKCILFHPAIVPIEGAVLFELLLGVCLVYVISNIITWNPTNNWQDILCTILWDRVYRTTHKIKRLENQIIEKSLGEGSQKVKTVQPILA
jgi:hypothetical protein